MLRLDPPEHGRLRRQVSPLFTARRIERLHPMVSQLATHLVAQFAARGHADLVAELALPLTAGVLCEFAGLPHTDRTVFHQWVRAVHRPEGGAAGRGIVSAIQEMDSYLSGVIEAKKAGTDRPPGPPSDVLTELACPAAPRVRLGDDELIAFGRDLLIGGFESTKNLISGGLLVLLTHPAALAELRTDLTLAPLAVEELLRYVPPFPLLEQRYATEDIPLGNVLISRGEPVVCDLSAANRDPARFSDPDQFNIAPAARGHLSFGPGTHHCLGASLARLEAETAIRTVLELPGLRLAERAESVKHMPGLSPGPETLPVLFTPVVRPDRDRRGT